MLEKLERFYRNYRRYLLVLFDVIVIVCCYYFALFFLQPSKNIRLSSFNKEVAVVCLVYLAMFIIFGFYNNMTRFESTNDYFKYMVACLCIIPVNGAIGRLVNNSYIGFKFSALAGLFITAGIILYRLVLRYILNYEEKLIRKSKTPVAKKNILIIGGGEGGKEIIDYISEKMKDEYHIVGVVDDMQSKIGRYIMGVKVLGDRYDIEEIVSKYHVDQIILSIHKIRAEDKKEIIEICQKTGAKLRVLPSTYEVIKQETDLYSSLRDVSVEDLLGRDVIVLENDDIGALIKNKVVLVTGGGGSIGSELCRQVMKYSPKQLVIFDIYENNLYDIEQELNRLYDNNLIKAVVGSVRDENCLEYVFNLYHPSIVFHAAAHKHVPLMEKSPLEAVKNNVLGTYKTANMADKYGVEKFVLISTDKAVNPTNVMGASKRFCEMIIQSKDKQSKTDYCAVRFGNVLGSNGSVIPLFKKQIANGGPVTVTHKDITRFFMTIPEAVGLILQAATYASGGEIFVLDMGEPVKIYDLAENLIKLSGYTPNVDMPIEITGLRPGEKLYEELLMSEEGLTSTKHGKIFVSKPQAISAQRVEDAIGKLKEMKYDEDFQNKVVKDVLKQYVKTYKDPEEVNKSKEK